MSEQPFTVRDSGKRESFASGMVRDTAVGKSRPDLVRDGPMYLRWVRLLTLGAIKYAARNWMKASGQDERDRFLESTDRHYTIWYTWRQYGINIEDPNNHTREPLAEDHAAATFFNMNGVEYCCDQLAERKAATKQPQTTDAAVNRPYVPTLPGRSWDELMRRTHPALEPRPYQPIGPTPPQWVPNPAYPPGTILCSDNTGANG